MLKNKSKIVILLIAFIMLISTISFATEGTTAGENARTDEAMPISNTVDDTGNSSSEPDNTNPAPEIYNGDLYLFGFDVEMDKLVDGNVFIFANNVNITGKVNGSLFVCANTVTFGENSYIYQTIYAAANKIELNGFTQDLYATANKIDLNYNSFIIRDLRVGANEFNFKGGVGRDAFVNANNFTFETEAGASAVVYGNLTYSSNKELELSKELVQGNINYSPLVENESVGTVILVKLFEFLSTLLFTTIIWLLFIWLAPKFVEASKQYISTKAFKAFGIGLLGIIISLAVILLLLLSLVGVQLATAVFDIVTLMMTLAFTITVIAITYKAKEQFKFNKKYLTFVSLAVVTLVIWALHQIPYVSIVVSIITSLLGFGIMVDYLVMRNKKEKVKE